jgi:hypothetical protein
MVRPEVRNLGLGSFGMHLKNKQSMKNDEFVIDKVRVTVTLFDDKDIQRLDEAQHRGDPLVGKYSHMLHKAILLQFKDHIQVYARNNQIFAINKDGTAHDGYHKVKIPGRVADELRSRYPDWSIPMDNLIEAVSRAHYRCEIARP